MVLPQPYTNIERQEKPLDMEALLNGSSAYLNLGGLMCSNCADRVSSVLLGLDGVWLAKVFLWERVALVAFDPKRLNPQRFSSVINQVSPNGRCFSAQVVEIRPSKEALQIVAGEPHWCWPRRDTAGFEGAWS